LEGQPLLDAHVLAAAGAAPSPPTLGRARPAGPSEELGEDVLEVGEDVAVEAAGATTLEPGEAEPVVPRLLLLVGEDAERLGGLLEARRRLPVVGVAVGVVLQGRLAVRLADLVLRSRLRDS